MRSSDGVTFRCCQEEQTGQRRFIGMKALIQSPRIVQNMKSTQENFYPVHKSLSIKTTGDVTRTPNGLFGVRFCKTRAVCLPRLQGYNRSKR